MESANFVLAITPPGLALLVEAASPLNERFFRNSVARDLTRTGHANSEALLDVMVKSNKASAELAGLAPTFVSCFATSFSVVNELRQGGLWWILGYATIFVAFLLVIIKLVHGKTLFELDDEAAVSWRMKSGTRKRTAVDLSSYAVYAANILLILLTVAVFYATRNSSAPA
ncbi:hypothetical protein AB4Y36_39755 [Paraburkholderia sp. BR10936]|uniref:hypothetical protein n=1 Tax=Paraburkholderia sp. BR10936 TaxID=3236993 RepID=UPI0034D19AAC